MIPNDALISIVGRVQAGDPSGMADLYKALGSVRYYLVSKVGLQRAEDLFHDSIIVVVEAIRAGRIKDPARLVGYARQVGRFSMCTCVGRRISERRRAPGEDRATGKPFSSEGIISPGLSPETLAASANEMEIARAALAGLRADHREILERFYFHDQTELEIRAAMRLTGTQFRLMKCRAKKRFAAAAHKILAKHKWKTPNKIPLQPRKFPSSMPDCGRVAPSAMP